MGLGDVVLYEGLRMNKPPQKHINRIAMIREPQAQSQSKIIECAKMVFCVSSTTTFVIILNGGISVGFSNHTGLIPVVRRILDPNYLANDFNIQLRLFHHRGFAYLTAAFVKLIGEDNALIVLNLLGFTFLNVSVYLFCRTFHISRLAVCAVSVLIATNVAWVGRGLETNTFVGNREINPPTFAHAFALFAISSLLQKRYKQTALLCGLTLLFHLQIGISLVLILSPFYLMLRDRFSVQDWFGCLVLFSIPALITIFDLHAMLQRGLVTLPFSRSDIDFRQVHHFEIASLKAATWVALHLAIIISTYIFVKNKQKSDREKFFPVVVISLSLTALSLIHFLDYYLLNFGSIVKVQFVRMSVFIPIFGAIALVCLINYRAEQRSKEAAIVANLSLIMLTLLLYAVPATRQGRDYSTGIRRLAEQQDSWVAACLWIRENTPPDALFTSPPGNEGFSYLSYRSNVGEFKINPDGPQYLAEWYARLRDLSGGELPMGKGFANVHLLNRAYGALSYEQLSNLGKKYNAKFAILPKSSAVQMNVIYENEKYKIIELPPFGK